MRRLLQEQRITEKHYKATLNNIEGDSEIEIEWRHHLFKYLKRAQKRGMATIKTPFC